MKKKENTEDQQWFFIKSNPNEEEIKEMIGMVTEVAVRILWQTYCYDFGGRTYVQKEGGPIGQKPQIGSSNACNARLL